MRCWLALCSFLVLMGCGSNNKEDLKDKNADDIYRKGVQLLKSGSYSDAADELDQVDALFPYSAKAPSSQVLAAYCNFRAENYLDATRKLEIFIRYHSSHELMPYALYLKAMCVYMQVSSVGRDIKNAYDARDAFLELINRYPESIYRKDSERRVLVLENMIAAHEMLVGRFYQKKANSLAAIGRFNFVISRLGHTEQAPEAYYRVVESCYAEGLNIEAERAYEALKMRFPNNDWTKKANDIIKLKRNS